MNRILWFICLFLSGSFINLAHAQEFDTDQLDEFLYSLEANDRAMGSLTVSKEGKVVYQNAIGHRYIKGEEKLKADKETRYRIWSITKTYTATMIMQMVEEGLLNLDATLDQYYPNIANAQSITIRDMLGHRSGIRDFTRDESPIWDTPKAASITSQMMINAIGSYEPDFDPRVQFQYSNSNYLLLGYLIERLDSATYATSLTNRISNKLGLEKTTYFQAFPDKNKNEAYAYHLDETWQEVDEGKAVGPVPAGAGEIVSTPTEMVLFIEALFAGKLVSEESLALMTDTDIHYGLGIFSEEYAGHIAYGHSGAFMASFSHLLYFPDGEFSIAYCTNGQAFPKEQIIEYAARLCYDLPVGSPKNRFRLSLFILLGLNVLLLAIWKWKRELLSLENLSKLGFLAVVLFWLGELAGSLLGGYNLLKSPVIFLDSQYSFSGPFMGVFELCTGILLTVFMLALFKLAKAKSFSVVPLFAISIAIISQGGRAIFPYPHAMAFHFDQIIILSALGPLLSLLFWWKKTNLSHRVLYFVSLLLMIIPIGLFIISRSIGLFGELVFQHSGGLIQTLYVGLTVWLLTLSLFALKQSKE